MSDTGSFAAAEVGAFESVVEILVVWNIKLNGIARALGNSLKQQDCFQYSVLVPVELVRRRSGITVEDSADIRRQKLLPVFVKEFSQHVNGQKRIFVIRTAVLYVPLESLDIVATVVLDEIEHASLVGTKSR